MDLIYQKTLRRYLEGSPRTKRRVLKEFEFKSEQEFFDHIGFTPVEEEEEVDMLDYVIAFDTTGSMKMYIENVKEHVKSLIPDLLNTTTDTKIGVVAFGDYYDMPNPSSFGSAYQCLDLTDDQNSIIGFISTARNTGGGDGDEFYELVINKINNETKWREGSTKTVLLIGDANPHGLGYKHYNLQGPNTIDWREEAGEAARLGIEYDTLCIYSSVDWYKELSKITGGVSMPFQSSNKMSQAFQASYDVRADKERFTRSFNKAVVSGDEELIGTYKSLSAKL
jgi:hypothetical protein